MASKATTSVAHHPLPIAHRSFTIAHHPFSVAYYTSVLEFTGVYWSLLEYSRLGQTRIHCSTQKSPQFASCHAIQCLAMLFLLPPSPPPPVPLCVRHPILG